MNRWSALAALLLAFVVALALRVPHLSARPFHNDEAVNATKVTELWESGRYAYDHDEYHGPTLHYATLPFLWLSAARNAHELADATLRLAPIAFGVGLILLLLLVRDALGTQALLWAALLTAVSPAMVFYSRYFIHEMPLIFFTALGLASFWRYTQKPSPAWAALIGASVGLMFATKETFVLALAAAGFATVATPVWIDRKFTLPKIPLRHALIALGAAGLMWLFFFSSFFTNFQGLADSIRTYLPWLKRAGGHSPHIHPWYFYFQRLAWFHPVKGPTWSEGLILGLALLGGIISLARRTSRFHCFLVFYTGSLAGVYTVISYKTPWCLLGFFHGLILLAAIGAAVLSEYFPNKSARIGVGTVLLMFTAQLGWQAQRASNEYASDRRNPYVYAQTVPDLLILAKKIEGIAAAAPSAYQTVVKVIGANGDYWPLPWYLRRFENIGWYEKMPDDPFAPIIVVSSQLEARLDEKSDKKWVMVGYTELRPKVFLELYVELELWKKYLPTIPRDPE